MVCVFGLQWVAIMLVCMMGMYGVVAWPVVAGLMFIAVIVTWIAVLREWRPIRTLANALRGWNDAQPAMESLLPERLPRHAAAEVVLLARGLHGLASRMADYNQRERNFTRDASHELRSPLTVIKMSNEMLADELGLSEFGLRSVQRIRRAAREMEGLVEAFLILARESDNGVAEQLFVVNEVLQNELEHAREIIQGRPVELKLEESARFAVYASPRVFAVLCWQLIRNACQQIDQGTIVIAVLPGMITVANQITTAQNDLQGPPRADRHGFELAIAQRISERFAWPLELATHHGQENIARIHFPQPLPA